MLLLDHKPLQPTKQYLIEQLINSHANQYLNNDEHLWEISYNIEIGIADNFGAVVDVAGVEFCVDADPKGDE